MTLQKKRDEPTHQKPANRKMILKFKRIKETKNTVRFDEVVAKEGERPIVGALYILKTAPESQGQEIKATIEVTK
jgi:hypothetical protein